MREILHHETPFRGRTEMPLIAPEGLLSSDNFRVSIPQFLLLILLLLEFLSGDILPILEHCRLGPMPATFYC
jgi:hypothetical protein